MKTFIPVSIFCLWAMSSTAAGEERPNIIMFLIDDQNPSSIAAFGGDTYTPNLDRMVEEGMKFTPRLCQQLRMYSISIQLHDWSLCRKLAQQTLRRSGRRQRKSGPSQFQCRAGTRQSKCRKTFFVNLVTPPGLWGNSISHRQLISRSSMRARTD